MLLMRLCQLARPSGLALRVSNTALLLSDLVCVWGNACATKGGRFARAACLVFAYVPSGCLSALQHIGIQDGLQD
jgi:hypothetical protein